jgi:cell division protein FtsQ
MHQQIVKYLNLLTGIITILALGLIFFSYFNSILFDSYAEIKHVKVNGVNLSDSKKIREISSNNGNSLFNFELKKTAEEINNLEWIKKVNIKKIFPNTISIEIIENVPFAYLLKDQKIYLIDSDGELIIEKNEEEMIQNQRLILSGYESDLNLPGIISNLNIHYPEILSQVKEMEFIERRRWNLIFNNDLLIKLPESKIDNSLKNLKSLIENKKILKSNIIEVDLRINDQAIIKIDGDKLKISIEET